MGVIVKVTFHGAAGIVSGSCFLLEVGKKRLLVDCGLFQGNKALNERNYEPFPFDPRSVDAVLLTHAHIDHSGLLPKLVRNGFNGPIYATPPTKDLLHIMLADSAHIQETEVKRLNRKRSRRGQPLLTPIYTVEDVDKTCSLLVTPELGTQFNLATDGKDHIKVGFWPAGHMLGAASITIHYEKAEGESVGIAFSGDIGVDDQPLIVDAGSVPPVDAVVMESTYGDRPRIRKNDRFEQLAAIIKETFARGGNVIIPAFAVGRVQVLLYGLHRMIHSGELNPANIFVDSPLAAKATDVFCDHIESFDEEAQRFASVVGDCPLYLRDLRLTRTPEESMAINRIRSGALVISSSGMADAGRIKHHLKHNLWRKECSVVFVSYQANGTLGRQIVDGRQIVRIHGEPINVRAQIHQIEGFSAHADQDELIQWAGRFHPPPKHMYLVHGESDALASLQKRVESDLSIETTIPLLDETVHITPGKALTIVPGGGQLRRDKRDELWQVFSEFVEHLESIERDDTEHEIIDQAIKTLEKTNIKLRAFNERKR